MEFLEPFQNELDSYHRQFRNPNLEELKLSGVYDLFPESDHTHLVLIDEKWPNRWINADSPGVYLFFSETLQLLYIGKVSLNHSFGSRFSAYFKSGGKNKCQMKGEWKKGNPRFVITIPVNRNMSFEAPALEEYLIMKFQKINTLENVLKSNVV